MQLWYADVHFRPGGSVGFYGHVQQRAGASAHAEAAAADRFPHSTQEEAESPEGDDQAQTGCEHPARI